MRRKPIALVGIGVTVLAGVAVAQDLGIQSVIGNVFLQSTTPGTVQSGHATISGTFRAGQVFVQQGSAATIPVVGNSTAVGAGSSVGGSFSSAQQSGMGARWTATATTGTATGVFGESRSNTGRGVSGLNSSATGTGAGVFGFSNSPDAFGGFFLNGLRTDKLYVGTDKTADATVNVVENVALFSSTMKVSKGPGLVMYFSGAAGTFYSNRPDYAVGLEGQATGGTRGIGVAGLATGGTTRYGVYGDSAVAAGSYAGYFKGNVQVTGSLSKGGGSFKIDHPLDPENRYLYHSFVESPDMMNVYNGIATTDARGYATVTMPDWFQALNRDFRYQLTVVDTADTAEFVQAKVVREVEDNAFRIRTSKGRTKVSWQVTGIRHDRWANANRIPVEEDKSRLERGTYLHAKEWGKPESMSLDARLGPKEAVVAPVFRP